MNSSNEMGVLSITAIMAIASPPMLLALL